MMKLTAARLVVLTVLVVCAVTVRSQPDEAPDEAELRSALQGHDMQRKEITVYRAALLTAEQLPLRVETIRAVSRELMAMQRDVERRFRKDPLSVNEGNSHWEYTRSLTIILVKQQHPAGIDAIAASQPLDLVVFGEAAIPALIRIARRPEKDAIVSHMSDALDALGQILVRHRADLSADSRAQIRQVAAQRLAETTSNDHWHILADAAYLAAVTKDPQLMKQVESLVDNEAEFRRRSITEKRWQDQVSQYARWGLEEARR